MLNMKNQESRLTITDSELYSCIHPGQFIHSFIRAKFPLGSPLHGRPCILAELYRQPSPGLENIEGYGSPRKSPREELKSRAISVDYRQPGTIKASRKFIPTCCYHKREQKRRFPSWTEQAAIRWEHWLFLRVLLGGRRKAGFLNDIFLFGGSLVDEPSSVSNTQCSESCSIATYWTWVHNGNKGPQWKSAYGFFCVILLIWCTLVCLPLCR